LYNEKTNKLNIIPSFYLGNEEPSKIKKEVFNVITKLKYKEENFKLIQNLFTFSLNYNDIEKEKKLLFYDRNSIFKNIENFLKNKKDSIVKLLDLTNEPNYELQIYEKIKIVPFINSLKYLKINYLEEIIKINNKLLKNGLYNTNSCDYYYMYLTDNQIMSKHENFTIGTNLCMDENKEKSILKELRSNYKILELSEFNRELLLNPLNVGSLVTKQKLKYKYKFIEEEIDNLKKILTVSAYNEELLKNILNDNNYNSKILTKDNFVKYYESFYNEIVEIIADNYETVFKKNKSLESLILKYFPKIYDNIYFIENMKISSIKFTISEITALNEVILLYPISLLLSSNLNFFSLLPIEKKLRSKLKNEYLNDNSLKNLSKNIIDHFKDINNSTEFIKLDINSLTTKEKIILKNEGKKNLLNDDYIKLSNLFRIEDFKIDLNSEVLTKEKKFILNFLISKYFEKYKPYHNATHTYFNSIKKIENNAVQAICVFGKTKLENFTKLIINDNISEIEYIYSNSNFKNLGKLLISLSLIHIKNMMKTDIILINPIKYLDINTQTENGEISLSRKIPSYLYNIYSEIMGLRLWKKNILKSLLYDTNYLETMIVDAKLRKGIKYYMNSVEQYEGELIHIIFVLYYICLTKLIRIDKKQTVISLYLDKFVSTFQAKILDNIFFINYTPVRNNEYDIAPDIIYTTNVESETFQNIIENGINYYDPPQVVQEGTIEDRIYELSENLDSRISKYFFIGSIEDEVIKTLMENEIIDLLPKSSK